MRRQKGEKKREEERVYKKKVPCRNMYFSMCMSFVYIKSESQVIRRKRNPC